MPDLSDLENRLGSQIRDQVGNYEAARSPQIERGPETRPWQALGKPVESFNQSDTTEDAWYTSLSALKRAIFKSRLRLAAIFTITAAVAITAAQYVPYTFSSTLHLYAPEKTDSISSRLSLFANRLEFASFPVDFKIPLGLVARRLRSGAARSWVINQYGQYRKKAKGNLPDLNTQIVSAETFYAEGSELLVIQGYANEPELASVVTNLYWDYFENELDQMRRDHLQKVMQWIGFTSEAISKDLTRVNKELESLPVSSSLESSSRLTSKMGDAYSAVALKLDRVRQETKELRAALSSDTEADLWKVNLPELQDLRRIDLALMTQISQLGDPAVRAQRQSLRDQATLLAKNLLEEKSTELNNLQKEALQLKQSLSLANQKEIKEGTSEQQKELLRQDSLYRSQLAQLDQLKAQIGVEASLTPSRLRVIQAAFPDPSTRRPVLFMKYGVCLLIAFLAAVLSFGWMQTAFSKKRRKKETKDEKAQKSPLGSWLGAVPEFGA